MSGQFRILTGNRFLTFNGSVLWAKQLVCLVGNLDGYGWAIQLKGRFYKVATSSTSFTDIKYHIRYQQIEYTTYFYLIYLFSFEIEILVHMPSLVLQHITILWLSICLCAVIQNLDYVFAENGLVAYKDGQLLCVQVRFLLDFPLCSSSHRIHYNPPKKNLTVL